jgi:hypothetical protein
MTTATPESPAKSAPTTAVLLAFGIGTLAAVGLGVYGRVHTPTGQAINLAGFSSGLAAKSFLTTLAFAFGLLQIVTAMGMFGRIPLRGAWVAPAHRWSGRIAVGLTVPVAVHCLYALGYQTFDARVAAHSLLGCLFYGTFVAKMLILSRKDSPHWALPLLGGLVFTAFTGLWMTAALWFFVNGA